MPESRRRFPKRVVEPGEPVKPRRRTRTGPYVPAWRAAGSPPIGADREPAEPVEEVLTELDED